MIYVNPIAAQTEEFLVSYPRAAKIAQQFSALGWNHSAGNDERGRHHECWLMDWATIKIYAPGVIGKEGWAVVITYKIENGHGG